jgi:hypothetical protein
MNMPPLAKQILEAAPEKCGTCIRPPMEAMKLAGNLEDPTSAESIQEAQDQLKISLRSCIVGQISVGGCAGNVSTCGYGKQPTVDQLMNLGMSYELAAQLVY